VQARRLNRGFESGPTTTDHAVPALSRHLRTCWIATWLAVFGLVFAPTLSRAMAAPEGGPDWAEVCSSQGNRLVATGDATARKVADADAAGRALLHQLTSHCPLCGLASSGPLAPPPAPFALWLSTPQAGVVIAQGGHAFVNLSPRTRPQPRAPPLSA
jgi:hypothetical protein